MTLLDHTGCTLTTNRPEVVLFIDELRNLIYSLPSWVDQIAAMCDLADVMEELAEELDPQPGSGSIARLALARPAQRP